MDVREKLLGLIAKAKYICANDYSDHTEDEYIVDTLLDNSVTVQEWKPISEPPKEKGTYLVCTDNGGVLLGHWYGTSWNVGGRAKKHLAHWMEKPEPLKGE